jgi:hypothetical protein
MARSIARKNSRYVSALYGSLAAAAMTVLAMPAWADPRPVVVELFTSQGCNSCPPADALLGELTHRDDVLPLAFHVDYWDNLGWRDMFSSAEATRRQSLYAPRLGLDSIYTPQMVIDGVSDVVGSRRGEVMSLLKGKRDGVPLKATRNAGDLVVDVGTTGTKADGGKTAVVLLVAYSDSAETKVQRGENAGKTLREFNIVRGFWRLGNWTGEAQQMHFDATKLPEGTTHVALLVQETGPGPIIGAATFPAQ